METGLAAMKIQDKVVINNRHLGNLSSFKQIIYQNTSILQSYCNCVSVYVCVSITVYTEQTAKEIFKISSLLDSILQHTKMFLYHWEWRGILGRSFWHTPFTICNQSTVPCPELTVVAWSVYRFLRRQGRWSGIPISLRVFQSFLWSTQSKALV